MFNSIKTFQNCRCGRVSNIFTFCFKSCFIGKLGKTCPNLSPAFKNHLQKQAFADILQNKCSEKIRKFHRKTPVLGAFFNKVWGLEAYNFMKKRRDSKQMFAYEICDIFNTFFYRTPPVASSPSAHTVLDKSSSEKFYR